MAFYTNLCLSIVFDCMAPILLNLGPKIHLVLQSATVLTKCHLSLRLALHTSVSDVGFSSSCSRVI
jgi:hypothetical protein